MNAGSACETWRYRRQTAKHALGQEGDDIGRRNRKERKVGVDCDRHLERRVTVDGELCWSVVEDDGGDRAEQAAKGQP